MQRKIHKRLDLNEIEAKMLKMKSKQAGMTEAGYLREVIMGSCPVEAPPKQFYIEMENINRIGTNINQIAHVANTNGYVSDENIRDLGDMYSDLQDRILEIKKIVLSARPYYATTYEDYLEQVEKAKREGRRPPTLLEYELPPEVEKIRSMEDEDTGWNYLGLEPPFSLTTGEDS